MSTRTIADIEADIVAVKHANPNWLENAMHTALITAYINEKNLLSATQPGNYLHAVYFIEQFPSHILHICILFAFDEFNLMT